MQKVKLDPAGFHEHDVGRRSVVDGDSGKEFSGDLIGGGVGDAFGGDFNRGAVGAFDFHPAVDVADPYGGEARDFDMALDVIEDGCDGILKALAPFAGRTANA